MTARWAFGIGLCVFSLVVAGCEREIRPFQTLAVASARTQQPVDQSPFQHNAYGTAEGKRFYEQYNCSGCHFHGGGGMGPPLMDDMWVYGSSPANIFESIVEGRPNGMPAWRNKIPDQQVWEIVAYVQSMSGQESIDVLPSRSDHMRYSTPENARRAETPVLSHNP